MGRTSAVTKILLILAFLVAVGLRLGYLYFWVEAAEVKPVTTKATASAPTTQPAVPPGATLPATETPVATQPAKSALTDADRRRLFQKDGLNGVVARNLVENGFTRFALWAPLSGKEPWAADAPPTAYLAPGYPTFLAVVYAVFGTENFAALFIVQSVIGALGCIFVFYLARRVFRSTLTGWLAWLAAAVSYFLITSVAMVNKANGPVLAATMITWSVLTLVAAADTGSWLRHIFAGIITGLTVLVVSPFVIIVPFAFLWVLAYARGGGGRRFAEAVVFLLFFLITLAPWTYRNYRAFHKCVPVVDGFGYHLWLGNNPKANGTDRLDEHTSMEAAALRRMEPGSAERLAAMDEVARYNHLAKEAWRWSRRNADSSISLRLRTFAYFWTGRSAWIDPADRTYDYESPAVLPVTLLMLVLALVGVGAGKTFRQRARAWMMYVVLILYPISYALTHVTMRAVDRIALDPLLLVLAAYAVATLLTAGRVGHATADDFELDEEGDTEPPPMKP